MTAQKRHTAAERREAILEVAIAEFAVGGLQGASTDEIARRVGISQPYLFRLFAACEHKEVQRPSGGASTRCTATSRRSPELAPRRCTDSSRTGL